MREKKSKTKLNPKQKTTKKIAAIPERQTRIQILQTLADKTNLRRKDVNLVFQELVNLIEAHLKKNGSGSFIIPCIGIKLRRALKQKTKARKMLSPVTGKEVTIAARPAHLVVKLRALKQLKDLVNK